MFMGLAKLGSLMEDGSEIGGGLPQPRVDRGQSDGSISRRLSASYCARGVTSQHTLTVGARNGHGSN